MKFISVIQKLLGIPKALKQPHILEMDLITEENSFTISKQSFNQNDTVIFLKEFYRELEILRKKDFNINNLNTINLIKEIFTEKDKFYLKKENTNELVNEIHLINMRIITKKKTIDFKNIEKDVSSLGIGKIKNAIKRFVNIKQSLPK